MLIAACFACAYIPKRAQEVRSSDVVVLDSPDKALLGGWIYKNPDNEFELLAFEFGPDSTFVVMSYLNGEMVGEKKQGKCTYLTVKGYTAIDMTLDGSDKTNHYYYTVLGDYATFTDTETGNIMPLQLVKRVTVKE